MVTDGGVPDHQWWTGSVLIGHKAVTRQTIKETKFFEEPQNFQPNSLYKEGLGTKVTAFGH